MVTAGGCANFQHPPEELQKMKKNETIVRGQCPACACGYVGHMTAEELKARAVGDEVNLSCPACGLIHLTREEAEDMEQKKVTETARYRQLLRDALAGEE